MAGRVESGRRRWLDRVGGHRRRSGERDAHSQRYPYPRPRTSWPNIGSERPCCRPESISPRELLPRLDVPEAAGSARRGRQDPYRRPADALWLKAVPDAALQGGAGGVLAVEGEVVGFGFGDSGFKGGHVELSRADLLVRAVEPLANVGQADPNSGSCSNSGGDS